MIKSEVQIYRQRLQDLASRLNKERSQLKSEALQTAGGESSGGLSDVPVHPADLGSHQFEGGLALGLLENEEHIIEEINGALSRLDQRTFGKCERCKKAIAKGRLHGTPYVRYCIACAREYEEKARL